MLLSADCISAIYPRLLRDSPHEKAFGVQQLFACDPSQQPYSADNRPGLNVDIGRQKLYGLHESTVAITGLRLIVNSYSS